MASQLTIRDALLELRRLNVVVASNAEEDLKRAQERSDAAQQLGSTLDRITTQLGFSVALETAATSETPRSRGLSSFPSARRTVVVEDEAKEKPARIRVIRRKNLQTVEQAGRDAKIVELRGEGKSHRQIAKKLNIGHSIVWRTLSKLPVDPIDAFQKAAKLEEKAEFHDVDPKFRFDLVSPLGGTEEKFCRLLRKNWPNFTRPEAFEEKCGVANSTVAAPTISRLRKKGVPIESAKQARDRGEDVAETEAGWRLIVD
jgi:biotin operon repressor